MNIPIYTLTCKSAVAAEKFAETLRKRGFINSDADHRVVTVRWGGGFNALAEIAELARYLDAADDDETSEFLMLGAHL